MNEITSNPPVPTLPDFLNEKQIELLKKTMLKGFSPDDQEVFVQIVLRARLDPWSRQIYATKRTVKQRKADGQGWDYVPTMIPVTSIQGLTAIADRTGNYDGCEIRWCGKDGDWREEWLEENEYPAAAKCTVFRKGRSHNEVGIARWMSFAGQRYDEATKEWQYTDFWYKLPDYMLGKCAKAMALRGAFPDQLSFIYIAEELQGVQEADSGGEELTADEAKIAENQRREAEARGKPEQPGVTVVETKPGAPPRPTPKEALEPAFPEDREPKPPLAKAAPAAPPEPEPPKATGPGPQPPPDDIDMTPEPAPAPEVATPWKEHVIKGVRDKRYKDRKIGELNQIELNAIEVQWLPKVRAQWNDATPEQQADAVMFEAAIAYYKMARPW